MTRKQLSRLIGGPAHGKPVPVPDRPSMLMIPIMGEVGADGISCDYSQERYVRHAAGFTDSNVLLDFYAHEALPQNVAAARVWEYLLECACDIK